MLCSVQGLHSLVYLIVHRFGIGRCAEAGAVCACHSAAAA
jgi:hypothetical protein